MVWEAKMGLLGIPITKGSPYAIFMKQVIFEMNENGQLNKLLRKWAIPKPDCGPIHNEGIPISLEKIISLLIISMIGILLAIIIVITENIICRVYKPRKHVSIKEANNTKLQRLFMKLQNNLNEDEIFQEVPITIRILLNEIQNHNDLLIDANC